MKPASKSLILLPGLLCDERVWQPVISRLKDNIHAMVIDLTDCDHLDAMLDKIHDHDDGRMNLMGFSMGGYVAQEYLWRHPQSIHRIGFVAVSATGYTKQNTEYHTQLLSLIASGRLKELKGPPFELYLSASSQKNQGLRSIIDTMTQELGVSVYQKQMTATLSRPDLREELKKFHQPTLVVGGVEDQVVAINQVQELAEALPNATLELIQDCGHFVPLEKPDELARLILKWLVPTN